MSNTIWAKDKLNAGGRGRRTITNPNCDGGKCVAELWPEIVRFSCPPAFKPYVTFTLHGGKGDIQNTSLVS